MNSWETALSKVCELYFSSEVNSKLEWILVGSVGSVLQGCEMTPGDVDIYTKNKEGIAQFAELLKEYSLLDKCEFPHGGELVILFRRTYIQSDLFFGLLMDKGVGSSMGLKWKSFISPIQREFLILWMAMGYGKVDNSFGIILECDNRTVHYSYGSSRNTARIKFKKTTIRQDTSDYYYIAKIWLRSRTNRKSSIKETLTLFLFSNELSNGDCLKKGINWYNMVYNRERC